jgi:peptide chain release factor 1
VVVGDVVNQFHDDHGLADTGTTEEADLAALGVGGEKVNNLNASDKNLGTSALLYETGGGPVDGEGLGAVESGLLVDGLANDVNNAAKGDITDGDLIEKFD